MRHGVEKKINGRELSYRDDMFAKLSPNYNIDYKIGF